MPNKRLFPGQATIALLNKGASAFLLRVKPQPIGCSKIEVSGEYWTPLYQDAQFRDVLYSDEVYKMPCQSNDMAYIPEAWRIWFYNELAGTAVIEYKIDGKKKTVCGFGWNNRSLRRGTKWLSPTAMPNIACRHVLPIGRVETVQFNKYLLENDLTMEKHSERLNMLSFELGSDVIDWYTTTYPDASLNDWGWYIERKTE